MSTTPKSNKKDLAVLAILFGILSAFALVFEELSRALSEVRDNQYLKFRHFVLFAEAWREPLAQWLVYSAINSLVFIVAFYVCLAFLKLERRKKFAAFMTFILLSLLLAYGSAHVVSRGRVIKKPNVIFIVIDALRASNMGVYGYERNTSPNLDAFARENILYKFAVAPSPWTLPSVAAFFSGYYPAVTGINAYLRAGDNFEVLKDKSVFGITFDKSFVTLAEILRDAGYQTASISGNPLLHEYLGFAQGFQRFHISRNAWKAGQMNQKVFELFDDKEFGKKPFFLYLHYFDPHEQYKPPTDFDVFKGPLKSYHYEPKVLEELNLYDGEILYCDSQIGLLIDFLKSRKLYDNSIIIITADHGEQFREHGRIRHGGSVFNQELHIPLFIKVPGMKKRVVETTVSGLDIFPTILDLVDIPISHPIQGYSLISELERRKHEGTFAGGTYYTHEKALVSHDGKKLRLLFSGKRHEAADLSQIKEYYIYDSRKDALEEHAIENRELFRSLHAKFVEIYKESLGFRKARKIKPVELEEVSVRQLRALGYLK